MTIDESMSASVRREGQPDQSLDTHSAFIYDAATHSVSSSDSCRGARGTPSARAAIFSKPFLLFHGPNGRQTGSATLPRSSHSGAPHTIHSPNNWRSSGVGPPAGGMSSPSTASSKISSNSANVPA